MIPLEPVTTTGSPPATPVADKDLVDSGIQSRSTYKERNISVTDEDEPVSMTIEDRVRYISVCEEDENIVDNVTQQTLTTKPKHTTEISSRSNSQAVSPLAASTEVSCYYY